MYKVGVAVVGGRGGGLFLVGHGLKRKVAGGGGGGRSSTSPHVLLMFPRL